MPLSTYAGLPVPSDTDTDAVPYWLSLLVAALDVRIVLEAANSAERDSKYIQCPKCTIVISTSNQSVWVKAADPGTNTWVTVWEPVNAGPAWIPGGSFGTNWTALHLTHTSYSPFAFHYIPDDDTVIVRGGLFKSASWSSGEVIAHVPTGLEPFYFQGAIAFGVYSQVPVACEFRSNGEIRLWGWGSTGGGGGVAAGAANSGISFDSVRYQLGNMT